MGGLPRRFAAHRGGRHRRARGKVLSEGRNRIHERAGNAGTFFGHKLAHAEVNALAKLDYERHDPDGCTLWTTTEPCPMCAGAARIADVGAVCYAAREPWGGSAEMFGTVPYMEKGNVRVAGPDAPRLEAVLVAMQVARFSELGPRILGPFLELYAGQMPEATRAGKEAHGSGLLRTMSGEGAAAAAVVRALDGEISSFA